MYHTQWDNILCRSSCRPHASGVLRRDRKLSSKAVITRGTDQQRALRPLKLEASVVLPAEEVCCCVSQVFLVVIRMPNLQIVDFELAALFCEARVHRSVPAMLQRL